MRGRNYIKQVKTYYVSDFETTSKEQYELEGRTRVFLHYTENIFDDTDNFLGMTIDEYFHFVTREVHENEQRVIYFHNLRFDILFLEYYLVEIGWTFSKERIDKTYHVIRDDKYNVYQFTLHVSERLIVHFKDSLKLLQVSVDKLPNKRGIQKLTNFDYKKIRYEKTLEDFTEEEILYIKHDVWKVKDVLKETLEEFGDYLTIASSSYNNWLNMFNKDDKYNYTNHFPTLSDEEDTILRKAYNGGLVILNPKYKGKIIEEEVLTFDVNSLYPSVMKHRKMPYGRPILISHSENLDMLKQRGYDLFVYCVYVERMKIKEGFHPFISTTKSYMLNAKADEFPAEINNMFFYWTSVDLELVKKYYEIEYELILDVSYAFKSREGIFEDYINYWMNVKETSEKNSYMYLVSKLRLNSLYGKFGTRPERFSYITCGLDENNKIKFELEPSTTKSKYYLPIAIFITAYARETLITNLQHEREAFIYADTDSLHLLKCKYKNSLKVDSKKLGYWKFESESKKSLYLANKQYIKLVDEKIQHTIASLNKENHHLINFDNFKKGFTIKNGKKMMKHVVGGHIIIDTDFTFN